MLSNILRPNQIVINCKVLVGADPDKVEDEAEDSEAEKGEEAEDYLNDPDFQNMSDSEGDDLPLFEVRLQKLFPGNFSSVLVFMWL